MQAGLEQLKSHGLPSGVVHEHTPNTLWSLRCSGKGGGDADVTGRGGGHLRDRRDQMSGLLNKVKLQAHGVCGAAAKLEEMQTSLDEVVGSIHVLEQRKANLLQELEVLDQKLFKVALCYSTC